MFILHRIIDHVISCSIFLRYSHIPEKEMTIWIIPLPSSYELYWLEIPSLCDACYTTKIPYLSLCICHIITSHTIYVIPILEIYNKWSRHLELFSRDVKSMMSLSMTLLIKTIHIIEWNLAYHIHLTHNTKSYYTEETIIKTTNILEWNFLSNYSIAAWSTVI
jgi:hypothetical protein